MTEKNSVAPSLSKGLAGARIQKYIDLEEQLKHFQCHPILIFGTASSGKSAFLQSMIYYGAQKAEKGFHIEKGPNIYPPDYENSADFYKIFINFYEDAVIKWRGDGRYPPHTQSDPFFIPVELKPSDDELVLQRFAFLEGNGELLHPCVGSAPDKIGQYPCLTELTLDLIKNYNGPLSLLFVAPTELHGAGELSIDRKTSCLCLADAMRQYFNQRPDDFQYRDNLCLLVSKWDTVCRKFEGKNKERRVVFNNLISVDYPAVVKHIEGWEDLWSNFSNRPNFRGDRVLMPYSSGVDIDGHIELDHFQQPEFDFFNRTMWNWLYGNATASYCRGDAPIRKTLCPDTQSFVPHNATWFEYHSIKFISMKLFQREK